MRSGLWHSEETLCEIRVTNLRHFILVYIQVRVSGPTTRDYPGWDQCWQDMWELRSARNRYRTRVIKDDTRQPQHRHWLLTDCPKMTGGCVSLPLQLPVGRQWRPNTKYVLVKPRGFHSPGWLVWSHVCCWSKNHVGVVIKETQQYLLNIIIKPSSIDRAAVYTHFTFGFIKKYSY